MRLRRGPGRPWGRCRTGSERQRASPLPGPRNAQGRRAVRWVLPVPPAAQTCRQSSRRPARAPGRSVPQPEVGSRPAPWLPVHGRGAVEPARSACQPGGHGLLGRSLLRCTLLGRSLLGRSLLGRSLLGRSLLRCSLLGRSLLGRSLLLRRGGPSGSSCPLEHGSDLLGQILDIGDAEVIQLVTHLATDLGQQRLTALAAALEQLIDLGSRVAALHLAVLDQLLHELLGTGTVHVGEVDAGIDVSLQTISVLVGHIAYSTWTACPQPGRISRSVGERLRSEERRVGK